MLYFFLLTNEFKLFFTYYLAAYIRSIYNKCFSMIPRFTLITSFIRLSKFLHAAHWRRFYFSDEKLFVLEPPFNSQNDRVWSARITDIPSHKKKILRFQNHSAVMVWGLLAERGSFP
jgi:hypothetical protein